MVLQEMLYFNKGQHSVSTYKVNIEIKAAVRFKTLKGQLRNFLNHKYGSS
jgi:hypothetical protein